MYVKRQLLAGVRHHAQFPIKLIQLIHWFEQQSRWIGRVSGTRCTVFVYQMIKLGFHDMDFDNGFTLKPLFQAASSRQQKNRHNRGHSKSIDPDMPIHENHSTKDVKACSLRSRSVFASQTIRVASPREREYRRTFSCSLVLNFTLVFA